jgi:peroxiredoxin
VGGKEISLSALKGHATLVVILTTDSDPCVRELTAIERYIWAKFRSNGLTVIGLGSGNNLQQLIEFKTKNNFTFDFAEDPQKAITARYATDYVPRCYVVGKDGFVKFTSIGLNKNDFLRMLNIIESETGK